MPYLSFAIICLLFGSNFILMSRAGAAFGPVEIGAGRILGAAVALTLIWRLFASGQSVPRAAWGRLTLVGLVANGYPYVAQPWLLAQGFGHSFFGMMVAFTPMLTIFVSIPMLGVWPTKRQIAGVTAGLVFMGLLLFDGSQRGITPGMLLISLSIPLSYATANTYLRRHLNDVPATPLSAAMLYPPLLLLIPACLLHGPLTSMDIGPPEVRSQLGTSLGALLLLGVIGTGVTMWLFVRLVQQQGPLFAGMVTYVVPVVVLLWGRFDGEMITNWQLVAITGVLASVAVVQYGAAKKRADTAQDDVASAKGEV